jgi:hypothetical protein
MLVQTTVQYDPSYFHRASHPNTVAYPSKPTYPYAYPPKKTTQSMSHNLSSSSHHSFLPLTPLCLSAQEFPFLFTSCSPSFTAATYFFLSSVKRGWKYLPGFLEMEIDCDSTTPGHSAVRAGPGRTGLRGCDRV